MFEEYAKLVFLKKSAQKNALKQSLTLETPKEVINQIDKLIIECRLLQDLATSVQYTDPKELIEHIHKAYSEGVKTLPFPLIEESLPHVEGHSAFEEFSSSSAAGSASLHG